MSMFTGVSQRVEAALERLSARERVLLAAMVTVLVVMGASLAIFLVGGRLDTLSETVSAKRDAIGALSARGEDYLANAAYNERINEQLQSNDLRLSTFIEGRAGRATIPRPREFRDAQQELDGVTLVTTTASFTAIDFDQMQRLLSSIEDTDELVFVRRVAISPARGVADKIDLDLTVATFRQGGRQ